MRQAATPKQAPTTDSPGSGPRLLAKALRLLLACGLIVIILLVIASLGLPVLSSLANISLVLFLLAASSWLLFYLLRKLLWRVSRRLAFSYFLIGVLPIPMVAALLLVGAYLLGGFFVSHEMRTSLSAVHGEVVAAATFASDTYSFEGVQPSSPFADIELAYYEDGQRVSGSHVAPEQWPAWLAEETLTSHQGSTRSRNPSLVALEDEAITVAAAHSVGNRGVLAYFASDLARALTRRSMVWVEFVRNDDPSNEAGSTVQIGSNEWTFKPLRRAEARTGIESFYQELEMPTDWLVIGLESVGALYSIADGAVLSDNVSATIFAPPQAIYSNLFSNSREIDSLGWVAFVIPAFLLFDLYIIAAVMAVFLIAGLSRAVNQLSRGTARVQEGDFATRIPVRRRDQLGALHESFNEMTENLEVALVEATQKELIDRELEIARDLQRSLLPVQLQFGEFLEIASFFEPSAAIGGDYYDIVPLSEDRSRIAVAICDVSGHGLPAGLRTAMLKAGLDILVRERKASDDIFEALDRIVRSGTERTFVTATLTVIDLQARTVDLTNAGHCPTYQIRDGEVREILLPGTPLGALRQRYGHEQVDLQPNDTMVWLSDGLIETTDPDGNVFGYERIVEALQSASDRNAAGVRDALVEAVREWSQGEEAEDDRTMVVMRYKGDEAVAPDPSPGQAARPLSEEPEAD